jgi:Tetratricopeptide repeat
VLLVVLSGCADLAPRFPPSVPPAASRIDPALDAQTRLLESAYRAYMQERYPLANALLQRFVDANPDSPRLSEARWWLARSYEQSGNLSAALAAYRSLVGEASGSIPRAGSYEYYALNRLDEFRRSLGPSSMVERRHIALWLRGTEWRAIPDIRLWIEQLADAGVTALIVEAGTSSREAAQSGPIGVYFQTSKVPIIEDLFTVIVPAAHAKGMAVLASLNLHEPWWATVNAEWSTVMADNGGPVSQQAAPVDVLHPDYQRFVDEVAQDLLRTDIDGLVVEARSAKGFSEEWSPTSRRMFVDRVGPSLDRQDQSVPPDAWRWAGWKSRTYLDCVARLARHLRETRPRFLVAVMVHERAVFFPLDALTDYGEDVAETKQRGLSLVVLPESGALEGSEKQEARLETVRQRLMPTPGNERQLWLGMTLSASEPSSLMTDVKAVLATRVGQAGTHLLLINGPSIP